MNTNDLLRQLRLESSRFQISDIEAKLFEIQKIRSEAPLHMHRLLIYNYEAFLELHRAPPDSESMPVNEKELREMEAGLEHYMAKYMPGEKDYKHFIRIVSIYLTFIAKKPLHPPGMFDESGQATYKNGMAVCPLRAEEIMKPGSLCRFCKSTV
jgi:uncharacterized protein (UPF0305 family)